MVIRTAQVIVQMRVFATQKLGKHKLKIKVEDADPYCRAVSRCPEIED
jgi:hypothetical protein